MADSYYSRGPPPTGPEIERLSASFAKLFRSTMGNELGSNLGNIVGDRSSQSFPLVHHSHHHLNHDGSVITQQPAHAPFGSTLSNASSMMGGIPMTFMCPPHTPPHQFQPSNSSNNQLQLPPTSIGIPLPGLEILDRIPFFKVADSGIFSGSYTCAPSYKIFSLQGEMILSGSSSKLFCPFDSRMKLVALKDGRGECIFQIKFSPSICECDSEEKRCFAVYSPLYNNPFGAILFEAGQLKYSLRILNALEGETFAVQFLNETDITIKGADGNIVAIINVLKKRGEKQKYTLTLTEELSTANKALFLSCIITLDLVDCEGTCSKCICLTPFIFGCVTILGLSFASYWEGKPNHNPKP